MKKKLLVASLTIGLAGLVGLASDAFAAANTGYADSNNVPGQGIVGTSHDLSIATGKGALYGADDSLDRICVWCHAPHHTAKPGTADAAGLLYLPLWNHGVTVTSFDVYASDFGEGPDNPIGTPGAENPHALQAGIGQPGSVSRLCLSCHDGSVAVNEYGFAPGRDDSRGAATVKISGQYLIGGGGDLRNHHPIGFDYVDVLNNDDEIADLDTVFPGTGVTIEELLYGQQMECVTCHDVHNTKNAGETFLWASDVNSQFCCTCHLKCQ